MRTKVKASRANSWGLAPPDAHDLFGFVSYLNNESSWSRWSRPGAPIDAKASRDELRNLIVTWMKSGPNLLILFDKLPALRNASHNLKAHVVATSAGYGIIQLQPGNSGEVPLDYSPTPMDFFFHFLLNPKCEGLAGPCATCGNYYIKRTRRQKVYCSQRCGLKATSRQVNEDRRKRLHEKKVSEAQAWISKWLKNKTKEDCKGWIQNHPTAEISRHWLTRAERNGELVIPTTR